MVYIISVNSSYKYLIYNTGCFPTSQIFPTNEITLEKYKWPQRPYISKNKRGIQVTHFIELNEKMMIQVGATHFYWQGKKDRMREVQLLKYNNTHTHAIIGLTTYNNCKPS